MNQPARASVAPRDPTRMRELAQWVQNQTLHPEKIDRYQAHIHEDMLRLSRSLDGPNFRRVGRDDLVRLIHMLDERFFAGRVLPLAKAEGIEFSFSSRMTSVAGKLVTQYPHGRNDTKRSFQLVLSSTLLFQTFDDVDRPVVVTGRKCKDRLEAMQRVAEHEMTHLVEMLIWDSGSCSQARFQSIARRFFGHLDYRHDLITQRERAARKFNIRVGDQVRFTHNGVTMIGRVNRITRRATVLVPSSSGERFSDGRRYARYYVPLPELVRVAAR